MLTIGFTATRRGATVEQLAAVLRLLLAADVAEVHHGDCEGGDADVDAVAAALCIPRVAHPPDNPALRAYCHAERVLDERPYKARNADIVRETCPLVALPFTAREQRYGGTWGTVRLARSWRRPVAVIEPGGEVRFEFGAERFWPAAGEPHPEGGSDR